MKILVLNLFLFSFAINITIGQQLLIDRIDKDVQRINKDSSYHIKTLNNDQFLDHTTDNGAVLMGSFQNDTVVKINCKIGLSYAIQSTEYYFKDDLLIFVYEKEETFHFSDSLGKFIYDSVDTNFEGQYYFYNEVLLKTVTQGERTFSDDLDSISKDLQLIERSKTYKRLLTR
ncbi:MAG: hypothetical protein H6600_09510 [Flavobacteriales bacterium]|nr:hypothetical protein [Flavobacteriales bacterium]MCB9198686.1 hypothetical protein [Flavobacteriales bacterium]